MVTFITAGREIDVYEPTQAVKDFLWHCFETFRATVVPRSGRKDDLVMMWRSEYDEMLRVVRVLAVDNPSDAARVAAIKLCERHTMSWARVRTDTQE